jgi:hypothetical protein
MLRAVCCFILTATLFLSCKSYTCDDFANDFKNDQSFHLKLLSKKHEGRNVFFEGTDLVSKQKIEHRDGGGFIITVYDKFNIGDTLIKQKGKYQIIIIRKGKKIIIPYECGKTYIN